MSGDRHMSFTCPGQHIFRAAGYCLRGNFHIRTVVCENCESDLRMYIIKCGACWQHGRPM